MSRDSQFDRRVVPFLTEGPKERRYLLKRGDERIQTRVTALLIGGEDKRGVETGLTENVSRRGIRVVTAKRWQRDETIFVSLPGFRFTCAARVAYCDVLRDGQFGTGLEFKGPTEDLDIATLASAIEFSRAR